LDEGTPEAGNSFEQAALDPESTLSEELSRQHPPEGDLSIQQPNSPPAGGEGGDMGYEALSGDASDEGDYTDTGERGDTDRTDSPVRADSPDRAARSNTPDRPGSTDEEDADVPPDSSSEEDVQPQMMASVVKKASGDQGTAMGILELKGFTTLTCQSTCFQAYNYTK
jgi:hypothetical protein